MDDKSRIAIVRIGDQFPDDISDSITYNLEDQIGSSSERLTTSGNVIDKEEYYPFGDSSLRTFSKKRYRYVGKEKDLESGLYYYGARYYAAWTCRFISVDPLAADYPFYTPYNYAGNKPVNKVDIDGMQEENAETKPDNNQGSSGGDGNKQYQIFEGPHNSIWFIPEGSDPKVTGESVEASWKNTEDNTLEPIGEGKLVQFEIDGELYKPVRDAETKSFTGFRNEETGEIYENPKMFNPVTIEPTEVDSTAHNPGVVQEFSQDSNTHDTGGGVQEFIQEVNLGIKLGELLLRGTAELTASTPVKYRDPSYPSPSVADKQLRLFSKTIGKFMNLYNAADKTTKIINHLSEGEITKAGNDLNVLLGTSLAVALVLSGTGIGIVVGAALFVGTLIFDYFSD